MKVPPIFPWLVGLITGATLALLAMGLWARFGGGDWSLLFLGGFFAFIGNVLLVLATLED